MGSLILFNHRGHVELGHYLYMNPTKWKDDWYGWDFNGGEFKKNDNLCFACEYAIEVSRSKFPQGSQDSFCQFCPLIWPNEIRPCNYSKVFHNWQQLEDLKLRSKSASIIRDLLVRDGVHCEG